MKRPLNIVFLLTDQLRYDALGCCGNTVCKTPHIDSLARDGVLFDSAFTTISLCSPARATMMTGLYPHRHGQLANTGNFNGVFDANVLRCRNLPQELKGVGYQTGYVGKWHLPKEYDQDVWPFDIWHEAPMGTSEFEIGRDVVQRIEWGGEAPFEGLSPLQQEEHQEYRVAERSMEMIETFCTTDAPFVMFSSFFGPHFPYSVPKPYYGMYDDVEVPQPANFNESFKDKPLIQQKEQLRWNASHLTWQDWQQVIKTYWAYCTFIDDQVGKIINHLKDTGQYDNTVVIFTTDHGDMLGNHRLFNKGFHMYDETHHIPFIMKVPGSEGNRVNHEFITTVDFMPTVVDCAGAEPTDTLNGRSALPLARGETPADWPQEAYSQFHGYEATLASVRALRTRKWKYVYNPYSADELYDVVSDPGEMINLAPRLGFKHVLRRMKGRMAEILADTDDGIAAQGSWQSNSFDLFLSGRER